MRHCNLFAIYLPSGRKFLKFYILKAKFFKLFSCESCSTNVQYVVWNSSLVATDIEVWEIRLNRAPSLSQWSASGFAHYKGFGLRGRSPNMPHLATSSKRGATAPPHSSFITGAPTCPISQGAQMSSAPCRNVTPLRLLPVTCPNHYVATSCRVPTGMRYLGSQEIAENISSKHTWRDLKCPNLGQWNELEGICLGVSS